MPHTTDFHESLLATHLAVDVRTPLEFAEDHIPGALNVPLLTNEERVEIGILYKEEGPGPARVRGLELTAHRMPAMVAAIARAAAGRPILVYCWRGGLRSKTVTSILDLTGYPAVQLSGGYKAFRAHVAAYFAPFLPPGPLVVIHGMTGIGKTAFLNGLHSDLFSVIDLEGIACHRGSAFGELGLCQDISQKHFETLLWDALRRAKPGQPIVLEGESRRIGRLTLPGEMYDVMQGSVKVWCEASLETRVQRLIAEYGDPANQDGMADSLQRIRKRIGGDKYAELAGYLERWDLVPFTTELIRHYYDKLYYKTREWREDTVISLEDYATAEKELTSFIAKRLG